MFSCEICKIFKNTYFEEQLRTTASANTFDSFNYLSQDVHFNKSLRCERDLTVLILSVTLAGLENCYAVQFATGVSGCGLKPIGYKI